MEKNIYVYIYKSLCCTPEINIVNQLYVNKFFYLKSMFRLFRDENAGKNGLGWEVDYKNSRNQKYIH